MNPQEQQRVIVLTQVVSGSMTVTEAAVQMGVSARQVRRVLAGFRREGVRAVMHGNRGRQPAHTVIEETRQTVRTLATGKYVGFNPQHLTEQPSDGEGSALSRSTVRRMLAGAGIASPRTRRPAPARLCRERRAQAGALVALRRTPLGNREHREVIGENRRHCQRQQGREGKLASLRATGIRQGGEQGVYGGKRHGGGASGCMLHVALLVSDQVSDTRILPSGASSFSTHKP